MRNSETPTPRYSEDLIFINLVRVVSDLRCADADFIEDIFLSRDSSVNTEFDPSGLRRARAIGDLDKSVPGCRAHTVCGKSHVKNRVTARAFLVVDPKVVCRASANSADGAGRGVHCNANCAVGCNLDGSKVSSTRGVNSNKSFDSGDINRHRPNESVNPYFILHS